MPATRGRNVAMDQTKFEPFGEIVQASAEAGSRTCASRWLRRGGIGLFWGLAVTIVVARGIYFEPGIFDGFGRAIAFLHRLLAFA
jgi:hypothetical protein